MARTSARPANRTPTGSVQRIGNRYTQPGDQEPNTGLVSNAIFYELVTGNFGSGVVTTFGSLKLPPYTLVNASLGLKSGSGLEMVGYVKNIFDANPKLSLTANAVCAHASAIMSGGRGRSG